MLTVSQFVFNPFEENTYIIIDQDSNKAIIVDPGMFNDSDFSQIDEFIAEKNILLQQVVNTHLHLDHSFGINHICQKYGVKLAAHPNDQQLGLSIRDQGLRFGFAKRNDNPVNIDIPLKHGDTISIGNSQLQVLHLPGHSQGGIALYAPQDGFALVGDSIFRGSVGRTDLPGGDHRQLIDSIHNHLLCLPENTVLLPGHGPHTTVGIELANNPYL
jgi:glyoxylase-like metal-dependent hydrolase (beta-lactamase superfamily II)